MNEPVITIKIPRTWRKDDYAKAWATGFMRAIEHMAEVYRNSPQPGDAEQAEFMEAYAAMIRPHIEASTERVSLRQLPSFKTERLSGVIEERVTAEEAAKHLIPDEPSPKVPYDGPAIEAFIHASALVCGATWNDNACQLLAGHDGVHAVYGPPSNPFAHAPRLVASWLDSANGARPGQKA